MGMIFYKKQQGNADTNMYARLSYDAILSFHDEVCFGSWIVSKTQNPAAPQ